MFEVLRSYLIASICMVSFTGCEKAHDMNCQHPMTIEISKTVSTGMSLGDTQEYLRTIDANFTLFDTNELRAARDKDADQFSSKILVLVELSSQNSTMTSTSEILTIGFDEDQRLVGLYCEIIGTGP